MLSDGKPILEQKLKSILKDAAESAYKTQFSTEECGEYASDVNDAMNKAASDFATKFSEKAAADMAEAIYNFVKGIGIMATIASTVTCATPAGPGTVAGVINTTDFTIM